MSSSGPPPTWNQKPTGTAPAVKAQATGWTGQGTRDRGQRSVVRGRWSAGSQRFGARFPMDRRRPRRPDTPSQTPFRSQVPAPAHPTACRGKTEAPLWTPAGQGTGARGQRSVVGGRPADSALGRVSPWTAAVPGGPTRPDRQSFRPQEPLPAPPHRPPQKDRPDYRLPTTDHRLPTTDHRLPTTDLCPLSPVPRAHPAVDLPPPPHTLPSASHPRRGGRVVYGSGLENRRSASFRGFESHPLRQIWKPETSSWSSAPASAWFRGICGRSRTPPQLSRGVRLRRTLAKLFGSHP